MNCTLAQDALFRGNTITNDETYLSAIEKRVRQHAQQCASCRKALERYQQIAEQINSQPTVSLLPKQHEQLMRALAKEHLRFIRKTKPETIETPDFLAAYIAKDAKEPDTDNRENSKAHLEGILNLQHQIDRQLLAILRLEASAFSDIVAKPRDYDKSEQEIISCLDDVLKTISSHMREERQLLSEEENRDIARKTAMLGKAQNLIFSSLNLIALAPILATLDYQRRKAIVFTLSTAYMFYWLTYESITITKPFKLNRMITPRRETLKEKVSRFLSLLKTPLEPEIEKPELKQLLQEFLQEAAAELDFKLKPDTLPILKTDMGRVARAEVAAIAPPIPGTQETPIGEKYWSAIQPIVTRPVSPGAKPLPTQESMALLEAFLTTPKSMSQLARESNGLWSAAGIRKNLNTSLGRIWEDLPPQDRQGYETAQEAMQAVIASPIKTEETIRKMRENERPSWKIEKPRYHTQNARKKPGEEKRRTGSGRHKKAEGEPKTEFSGTHIQHLSDAATERWRRYREEQSSNTST